MQFRYIYKCSFIYIVRMNWKSALFFLILILGNSSCKKIVAIPEPVNTITTSEVFSTDAVANSSIIGIYNFMANNTGYANGYITIYGGLSADELSDIYGGNPYEENILLSNTSGLYNIWADPYFTIYMSNAVIEGLQASTGVTQGMKSQLMGEAKFFRAFCHFYLVNLFGDVPLITSTAFSKTSLLTRTPSALVYQQIINDLKDAQSLLNSDYSVSGGQRIRVNRAGATALLARVYLFTNKYDSAEIQATSVINDPNYNLLTDLNTVFLRNSKEAILQLQPSSINYPYTTNEGNVFIPVDQTSSPNEYYLTAGILNAFEQKDKRRIGGNWIDSTIYSGTTYYYPYKYKYMTGTVNATPLEYIMVLRLAEQYLIRAEARAQQNNVSGAVSDLNMIRNRAGLPNLSASLTKPQTLDAVIQERRVELFAEWGNRWLDLKRTGRSDSLLASIKSQWVPTAKLYPIPLSELQNDPNLIQNPGYQ